MNRLIYIVFLLTACSVKQEQKPQLFIAVLGVAQDAGYPQPGCIKECCSAVYAGKEKRKHVVSLAFVNNTDRTFLLFEATPDISQQLTSLQAYLPGRNFLPAAVFLTHAHMGHYTGLMYFGREAMNTASVPVYTLPRLKHFLGTNGPWSQLVTLKNIELREVIPGRTVVVSSAVSVTPLLVPHRDEFSETAAFLIQTKNKKLLFVPDIDKWNKWEKNIVELVQQVDYALLDATFYRDGELPNRNMREVPHPFVEESVQLFKNLTTSEKGKIYFIHFNHTNPLLQTKSAAKTDLRQKGFNIAEEGLLLNME